jgi:hypothetical protein
MTPAVRNCRITPLKAAVQPWARPMSLSSFAASQNNSSGHRSGQCQSRQRSARRTSIVSTRACEERIIAARRMRIDRSITMR